jgi:hypothetical protein
MTLPKRVKTVFRREKMKKIIASAVGLMLVGGVAATSVVAAESQFGGMWSLKSVYRDNFVQDSSQHQTENRTRLYYTAKFDDHFKFVNKFEFDTNWGDNNGGKIGADGKGIFEIKNSYVDYTMGTVNTKLGIQAATISRGFIFSDDFSGAVVTADFGNVKVPVLYAAAVDEEINAAEDGDVHLLSAMPAIKISDSMQLTPHVTYLSGTSGVDTSLFWIGADFDMKMDAVSAWATFIYNGGDVADVDISGFLAAVGADAGIVHGQVFYATGDDGTGTDSDAFVSAPGSSYYWSEILGLGVFDLNGAAVAGTNTDNITNILAGNVGVTLKPMDKLTAKFDVWYAMLAEDDANGEDELGLEFDGMLTYALEDNLNLDVVFAYLVAGDAVGDDDVIETGVRVSLAF